MIAIDCIDSIENRYSRTVHKVHVAFNVGLRADFDPGFNNLPMLFIELMYQWINCNYLLFYNLPLRFPLCNEIKITVERHNLQNIENNN